MKRVILVLAISAALVALFAAVAVAVNNEGRTFQCDTPDCEGTDRDDTISERSGTVQDNIDAMGGDDTVNAALFGSDADTVRGGTQDDVIRTDDGDTRDTIDGGAGNDVCIIDRESRRDKDSVTNCEDVIRR